MSSGIRDKLAQFEKHSTRAGELFHEGKKREAADEYWISFHEHSPSLTHPNRWDIFRGYTSILKEKYFPPSDQDWKNLKSVVKDKQELKLFRIEAGLTMGLMHFDQGNRFECSETYYMTIQIGEAKYSKFEKKLLKKKFMQSLQLYTMEYLVNDIMSALKENLDVLTKKDGPIQLSTDPRNPNNVRSDGTPLPEKHVIQPSEIAMRCLGKEGFLKLISVGGVECDACGKKETKECKLKQCTRCNKGFYCSKECQTKSWNVYNHKKHCRSKEDPIKSGDFVLLYGLKSKPELNHTVVQVVGRDPNNKETRWTIKTSTHGKKLSINTKNINQLRPYDCLRRED